jgi:hypothetical protein
MVFLSFLHFLEGSLLVFLNYLNFLKGYHSFLELFGFSEFF